MFGEMVKWAAFIVFLFILFSVIFTKTGLTSQLANLALGMERFLPFTPSKEVVQDESLPQATINAQQKFMDDINNYRDKENCLLKLSSLNGLGELRIWLSHYNGITSRIEKRVGKEGGIRLNPLSTYDQQLKICVINPEAFYDCYLNAKNKDCTKQLYHDLESVKITKDSIIINGNSYGLGQFLFKPDKDTLCFIPVHRLTGDSVYKFWQFFARWGCDAGKDTIDNDCIKKMQNSIKLCSEIKDSGVRKEALV